MRPCHRKSKAKHILDFIYKCQAAQGTADVSHHSPVTRALSCADIVNGGEMQFSQC